jgi:hypothetical protein
MKRRAPKRIESLAKTILPGQSRRMGKIRAQVKAGHNSGLGFLHIPKTGGSGIRELGRKAVRAGLPFPVGFSHGWTLAEIRRRFPQMRLAFILRDPLERAISGFNSRLRQGRPTYKSLWKPAEAAAFAHFPEVERWLDALLADDDLSLSACAYARRHVTHLRWNYRYYFKNPEAVAEHADHLVLIGRIERTDDFIEALLAEAGIPPERAAGLYARRHEAQVRPSKVLARYGEGDLARLRARFAEEYAIHEALLALGRAPRAADAPAA